MHILPNISRNKGSQTKFGQLVEYDRNILEKSYTKHVGETSPRPFSGKLKLKSKVLYSLFYCIPNVGR